MTVGAADRPDGNVTLLAPPLSPSPSPPLPSPDGPCLQRTAAHRRQAWWKNGLRVGSLRDATAKAPDAHALALLASREDQEGTLMLIAAPFAWGPGLFSVGIGIGERDTARR